MEEKLHKVITELKEGKANYEELYYVCKEMIYKVAYSILKNDEDSKDVQQIILIKMLKMPKEQLPSKCEVSWLYSVIKNESINFWKKKKQIVNVEELYDIAVEEEKFFDIEFMESYKKIFGKLNTIDREIVSLRIFSDFTFKEISKILNIPIGTVQWKYYKSIDTLRKSINFLMLGIFALLLGISSIKCETIYNFSKDVLSETLHYEYNFTILSMILFCVTIICMISSIFFYNIFKKNQQKLKVKMSNKKEKSK